MLSDVARGLAYLHSEVKVIHRDVKSANVLIDRGMSQISIHAYAYTYASAHVLIWMRMRHISIHMRHTPQHICICLSHLCL